jgi:dTDP-4-amino-4,6-dideoxygalactose transaminase
MTETQRKQALARGLSGPWQSEPLLGSQYGEEEIEAAVRAIRSSLNPSVGFGFIVPEIEEFEEAFAQYVGTRHAVSISTASVGLDMAMRLLDLQPGDEVICPTINFRAAPMSVLGHGGKLVLCEADRKTLCADPADVEKRITPRTRAILVTHMNGLSAAMDDLLAVAQRHPHPKRGPIKVIGDAARACGGGYQGTKIGKKGWLNVFSFHTMKNMTTLGEGGMITTDDDSIVDRLREMRQFGGEGWGSSYKMTKVQAAVGLVQLRRLDGFIAARRKLAQERSELLAGCPHLVLPEEPKGYLHSYYMYTVMVSPDWRGEKRDRLIALLKDEYGVDCGIFNPPVHRVVPFIQRHTQGQELPVSDELGERLSCPPIHPTMSQQDNAYIAAALWEAVDRVARER